MIKKNKMEEGKGVVDSIGDGEDNRIIKAEIEVFSTEVH